MSQSAIKNFFQSNRRNTNRVKRRHTDDGVREQLSTLDIEEALRTDKRFDSELLFKTLTNYNSTQYIEGPVPEDDIYEIPVKPKCFGKRTMRLVELTDQMIYKKEQEEAYREEEEYLKSFQSYVPPPRPKCDLDFQLEEMTNEIEKSKKELDSELIKPIPNVNGYVPPTRKKEYNLEANPNVKRLNSVIQQLENGINQVTFKVNKENERWIQYRKLTYRNEYVQKKLKELSAMQEESIDSSNM